MNYKSQITKSISFERRILNQQLIIRQYLQMPKEETFQNVGKVKKSNDWFF